MIVPYENKNRTKSFNQNTTKNNFIENWKILRLQISKEFSLCQIYVIELMRTDGVLYVLIEDCSNERKEF